MTKSVKELFERNHAAEPVYIAALTRYVRLLQSIKYVAEGNAPIRCEARLMLRATVIREGVQK